MRAVCSAVLGRWLPPPMRTGEEGPLLGDVLPLADAGAPSRLDAPLPPLVSGRECRWGSVLRLFHLCGLTSRAVFHPCQVAKRNRVWNAAAVEPPGLADISAADVSGGKFPTVVVLRVAVVQLCPPYHTPAALQMLHPAVRQSRPALRRSGLGLWASWVGSLPTLQTRCAPA